MCDKQPNFGQILKIEELEFADNFFVEYKRRKHIEDGAQSFD